MKISFTRCIITLVNIHLIEHPLCPLACVLFVNSLLYIFNSMYRMYAINSVLDSAIHFDLTATW